MRLLLFLKPWLLMLLLLWELDISDSSDPNKDGSSTPSNQPLKNTLDTTENQQKNSPQHQLDISKFVILTKDEKSSSKFVEVNKTDYSLKEDNNNYHYQLKNHCKCSMLKYGDQIVWEHDYNKYGYYYPREISVTSDEIYIEMSNCAFVYKLSNNKWNLISKFSFDSFTYTDFTIFTLDDEIDSRLNINNTFKYDLFTYLNGLVMFMFKNNAKCVKIIFDVNTVWEYDHNQHLNNYPTSILYKPDGIVYIDFETNCNVYEFDSDTNKWMLNSDKSKNKTNLLAESEHPKTFIIKTSDDVNGTDLKENDTSKYKVYNYSEGLYLYMLNSDTKCMEVKYNGNSLWKYDHKKHPNKFPRSIFADLNNLLFDFEFGDETLRYRFNGSNFISYIVKNDLEGIKTSLKARKQFFKRIKQFDVPPIKIEETKPISEHSLKGSSNLEITPKIDQTKEQPESSTSSTEEPKDTSSGITPASSAKPEESEDTTPGTPSVSSDTITPTSGSSSVLESQLSSPAKSIQSIQDGSKKQDLSSINSCFAKFNVLTEDTFGDKMENDETKYNLKVTNSMIVYKFISVARCIELKYDNQVVWKYDHSKCKGNFPGFVFFHNALKKIYVKTNELLFVCSTDDQKWSGSEVKPVQLDIKSTNSNDEYEYSKDEKTKIITFTAKDNVVFEKIIKKKGMCERGSEHILYQPKDSFDFVYNVVVRNMGSDNENVTLYHINGRVLTLTKSNDYSYSPSWVLFGPPQINIFTLDPSDNKKTKENDTSQYDIFNITSGFYYVFKKGAKCTEVMLKDESIWTYSNKSKDPKCPTPYPKSVSYDTEEVRFLFNFGLENAVYKKEGDIWDEIRLKLITFDIEGRETTDQYKCTKDEKTNVGVFKARKGYGFNKIIQKKSGTDLIGKDKVVWESDFTNEHAVKVLIDGINSTQSTQEVQVYLANGDVLKYTKRGDTCKRKKWTQLEIKRHVAATKVSQSEPVTTPATPVTIVDTYVNIEPKTPAIPVRKPIDLYIEIEESNRMLEFSKDEAEDLRIYTAIKPYGFDRIITSGCCHSSRLCKSNCCKSKCCKSNCCKSNCCGSECCKSNCCDSDCCKSDCDEDPQPGCCLFSWCTSGCCKSDCCDSVLDCCLFSWIKPLFTSSKCCKKHVIWEADDESEYAYKVIVKGSGDKPKYMLILSDLGDFVLYYKDKDDADWRDITLLRISFSDFSIFGFDKFGFGVKQLDTLHYKKTTNKFMFGYQFKERVKCSSIKYKDKNIWSYSNKSEDPKCPTPYPLGLYYDLFGRNLYILYPENERELISVTYDYLSSVPSRSISDSSNRIAFELDINNKSNTEQYEYSKNEEEDLRVYTAKQNYAFSSVVKKTKIWYYAWLYEEVKKQWHTYYTNEYAYKVILKGSGDKPKYILMLPVVGDFVLYYQQNDDADWRDITSSRLSFKDFSIFGTDKSGSDVKQFDYTHYDKSTHKFMFGYKFKDGVKCTQIKYKNVDLWKHDPSNPHPLGLYYDLVSRNLQLLLSENQFKSLPAFTSQIRDISFAKFKVLTEGSAYPNDTTRYNLKVTPDMITYKFNYGSKCTELKYDNKPIWNYDKEIHGGYPFYIFVHIDIKKIYIVTFNSMFVCSLDNKSWSGSKSHLANLDIRSENTNEEYEYSKFEQSKVSTFKAKEGYGFNKVVENTGRKWYTLWLYKSTENIWESDNKNEYAVKVTRDGTSSCRKLENVDIELVNGDVLKYVKGGCTSNQWINTKIIEANKPTPNSSTNPKSVNNTEELIELDINSNNTTYQYNYSNKVSLYIAKENGVFEKVIRTKGEYSCGSDQTLYSARFHFDCVNKVVVENMGSDNENVTLHHINGRVLTLKKKDYSSFISKSWVPFGPLEITIITENSCIHNDTKKYDIFNERDVFLFVFKPGSKCIEVIYENISVWKRNIDDPYPKSFLYDRSETRFMFSFDGENIVHKKVGDKWNKANYKLSVLSVNNKETNLRYYYNKKEKKSIATFTAKKGHGFNKIIENTGRKWYTLWLYNGTRVVWESDFTNEHAVKVLIDGIGFMETTEQLHVYLSNHKLLKFIKTEETENEWILKEIKTSVLVKTTASHLTSDPNIHSTSDTDDSTLSVDVQQPKITSGMGLELDIDSNKSTDHVEFSKNEEEDLRVYTAKQNYAFSKVGKKKKCSSDIEIWETKNPKEYVTKVILKNPKSYPKYMLMLPVVGEFKLYYKFKKEDNWRDITTNRISFKDFSIFGFDKFGFGVKQLDFVHYERSTVYFLYGYKFRDGVKCSSIKYKDKNIWKASDLHKDACPIGLYLNLINKDLYLLFQLYDKYLFHSLTGPKCKLLKFSTNSTLTPTTINDATPAVPTPSYQLVVLDVKKNESCNEYEYFKDFNADIEVFKAKPGYMFKQVNHGNSKRWEAKNENYKTEVFLVTENDGKVYITFERSDEQSAGVVLKNREDDSLSTSSLKYDFKVITLDPSDNKKTNENDTSQYDFEDNNIMLTYKFKKDAKCVKLKHGSRTIWKYDENLYKTHPKSLYLFKTIFLFVLELSENKFFLYGLTSDNNFESQQLDTISSSFKSNIKIVTKDTSDDTKTKENDTSQYFVKDIEFAYVYNFKNNAKCVEVKSGSETLWKYDDDRNEEYPDSIYIMSSSILVFPKVSSKSQ